MLAQLPSYRKKIGKCTSNRTPYCLFIDNENNLYGRSFSISQLFPTKRSELLGTMSAGTAVVELKRGSNFYGTAFSISAHFGMELTRSRPVATKQSAHSTPFPIETADVPKVEIINVNKMTHIKE